MNARRPVRAPWRVHQTASALAVLAGAVVLAGSPAHAQNAPPTDRADLKVAERGAPAGPQVDYDLVAPTEAGATPAKTDVPGQPDSKPDDARTAMHERPAADTTGQSTDEGPTATTSQVVEMTDPIIAHVRTLLESNPPKAHNDDVAALKTFYATQSMSLWVRDKRVSTRGESLLSSFTDAADWGLDPKAFASVDLQLDPASGDREAARVELTLAADALTYARHARGGRIANPTKQLSSYIDRKPTLMPPPEVISLIANASDPGATLRGLHPRHHQFVKLREHLLKLRKGAEHEDDVVRVPNSGPLLSQGKRHPHVALIRERLGVAVPDIPEAEKPAEVFDAALADAVKAFQKENGLSQDGVVGSQTRAAFNGGNASINEEMLIANMEAWRWMPEDLGDFYVTANLPEFKMRVIKNGKVVHQERVITGKTSKQTPIFSDVMEHIVFHPFWGVPNSIKVNDILPSLARGSNAALNRHNLRIQHRGRDIDPRSVDWTRTDIRNFHVYQPPGRGNVLGVVKFMFPNKHQVYMHDTPTKNLFNSTTRTYSHGCVRVRDPQRFAEILLNADRGWPNSRVASLIDRGPENNTVKLDTHIPVHMVYFTAWVDEAGDVKAFGDVYGHEARIKLALAGKWNQIKKHSDHLAPVKIDRKKLRRYAPADPVQEFFDAVFGF